MVSRSIQNVGRYIVTELNGEEFFALEYGNERWISAADLRAYCGGDTAVPTIRCEAGANARKVSDFANAEGPMASDDRLTGLQGGNNVNFSRAQVLAPLVESLRELVAEMVAEELARREK